MIIKLREHLSRNQSKPTLRFWAGGYTGLWADYYLLWEREPLRWLAVRYMQNAFFRIDEAGKRGKTRPMDALLAEFLKRH